MNLRKKKRLVARTLKIGVSRVKLDSEMKEEIKEAITRQDIRELKKEKIVGIKEKKGRRKKRKRKTKRKQGSIKKKVKKRKEEYVKLVRKLRGYIKDLKNKGKINKEQYYDLRKKIKVRKFKNLSQLKNFLSEVK